MPRVLSRSIVALLCLALAACASARLRREITVSLRDADAQAARGCHACLLDALAIYHRLRPRDATTQALIARRLLRTSLLLTLREKEIGLDARAHLERARVLAASGTAADRERLELVEVVPWAPAGVPRETQMQQNQRVYTAQERLLARLTRARAASDDPELDTYIDLSLACTGRLKLDREFSPATLLPTSAPGPLLLYRLGACLLNEEPRLRAALDAEPRFAEIWFFLGRNRLVTPEGPPRPGERPAPAMRAAREAFGRAHAAFPASAAIAMELANATRAISYRDALPLYVDVVTRVPDHQDAWFGKALCETYLQRPNEAIASLTTLLGLGQWLAGDAYYWRAWNRHQLKELDAAWADVERAKRLLYSTNVYGLAGIIAYDRKELGVARADLERALEISPLNCAAAWYLGLTHAAEERWPASAEVFSKAAACYRADADIARNDLTRAEALEPSNESRAEQIATARATIDESLRQEALSAYNAAFGFVRAQDIDRARPLLELARQHQDLKARADELLAYVNR